MKRWIQFALLLAMASTSARAAEIAVLQNGSSIRCQRREVIGAITRLYTGAASDDYVDVPTSQIDHFEADLTQIAAAAEAALSAPAKLNLDGLIADTSGRYAIDPDLLASVIRAESGFNAHAVSPKGAQGLMQLMPQTASQLGVANAFDASANVEGGTRYLRELLERYNFDLIKALAAYNAGPQRVDQYHGVPPYYETQAYVARIVRDYNRKKLAERKAAKAAVHTSSTSTSHGTQ